MTTTSNPTGRRTAPAPTLWAGWIVFASLMLIMVGTFNAIDGLTALLKDQVFLTTGAGLLVFDLTTWGWIHLLFGIAQVAAGIAMFSGAVWARIVAVGLVIVNACAQLAFLSAYPLWSTIVIALDVVTLWAIVVHGDEARNL
jgi:hypothetical protein